MRRWLFLSMLMGSLLAACGQNGPGATATPTAGAGPSVTPTQIDQAATPTPTVGPAVTEAAPTATAIADGLGAWLGTPDPNPNCPDHYPWFFDNPADECAGVVLNTWVAWQPFEYGLMVWTQEGGRTYVLRDDGSPFKPYQLVSDPVGVPLPEPDASIVPPAGLYVPERGFALFWRNLVPGHEWVREHLGWATAPEAAYSSFWQCRTEASIAATLDGARCYLLGPRDEIIVLAESAGWWTYVQRAVR